MAVEQRPRVEETDVLVIGGGLAGCWAAIRARQLGSRVILMDKARVAKSGASTFINNMLAPVPEGQMELWRDELIELGEYFNDQEWVQVVVEEQGQRVQQLAEWGVPFERNAEGELRTKIGRGHIYTRIVLINGHRLMAVLRQKLVELGVQLLERVSAVDLLTSDGAYPTGGRVCGAAGVETRTSRPVMVKAGAVVITSGQMGTKLRAHFVNNLSGDGQAMAYRAGAELVNMEFCTSGNLSYYQRRFHSGGQSLLQGMGAIFVNAQGERFMTHYDPVLKERSNLAYLCQAFAKEALEGRGPLEWDMSSFSEEDVALVRRLLPTTLRPFDEVGINVREQRIECTPVISVASSCGEGGIRVIDTTCATSLPGLYSAGAAAWNPVHGTYTVGGINLAFCNVGGYRAGEHAALWASNQEESNPGQDVLDWVTERVLAPLQRSAGPGADDVVHQIQQVVIPAANSIFKNETRIRQVLLRLAEIRDDASVVFASDAHDLVKAHEAVNLVTLAQLVFLAALERRESRSWHYRVEFPNKDNQEWLKWITVSRKGDNPQLKMVTIPFDRYPVAPPRELYPHPIQFTSI